ncbi:MAG: DivIVA domain-containing protein [Clostridia bacterium]|nr:DivIVA domain-containing protein [Clostridia bacterium]
MLTPIDIQNQDFAVKLRGYDAEEVDDFLDLIGVDYEKLYKENSELRDRVTSLKNELEYYKNMEQTLQQSIMLAQKAAEDIEKNAAKKADVIVNEAEAKSQDAVRITEEELAKKRNELSKVKLEVESYKARIKGNLSGILEMLEKME